MFRAIKAVLHTWAVKLGWAKQQTVYERDAKLADVINIIVNAPDRNAFIVAVETKQAMLQVMSYMEKNLIPAVAVFNEKLGYFERTTLQDAVTTMEYLPTKYRVYVMHRSTAVVGWRVPSRYSRTWDGIHLLASFTPREPWLTQFQGRLPWDSE